MDRIFGLFELRIKNEQLWEYMKRIINKWRPYDCQP